MDLNQNETLSKSGKAKAESRKARPFSPRSAFYFPLSAFTLTELLVVITIIAILAAVAIPAAMNALENANRASITLELQQLGQAMEDFKNDYGAYPPNGMNNVNGFIRMFKQAFPRHQEPQELIEALAGSGGGGIFNVVPPAGGGGLTGAEAIYFWLGGFSKDPQFPISGQGGPSFADTNNSGSLDPADEVLEDRNGDGKIKLDQLGPRNSSGFFDDSANQGRFVEYDDPRDSNVKRRINLWLYIPAKSTLPAAYFDTSRHKPLDYDLPLSGSAGGNIFALKKYREGFDTSQTPTARDIAFANDGKFQILHCGLDDIWGGQFIQFSLVDQGPENVLTLPEGPFIGDIADTLTNFTTGTLEAAQE